MGELQRNTGQGDKGEKAINRRLELIRLLLENQGYISMEELAKYFGVSVRTIRDDLNYAEEFLRGRGMELVRDRNLGIGLERSRLDARSAKELLYELRREDCYGEQERIDKILHHILLKEATGGFPLVLHGGSGTGDEALAKAAKMGINKVNIGCELFAAAIEELEQADTEGNGAYGLANIIAAGYGKRLAHFFDVLDASGKAWTEAKKEEGRKAVELTEDTIL